MASSERAVRAVDAADAGVPPERSATTTKRAGSVSGERIALSIALVLPWWLPVLATTVPTFYKEWLFALALGVRRLDREVDHATGRPRRAAEPVRPGRVGSHRSAVAAGDRPRWRLAARGVDDLLRWLPHLRDRARPAPARTRRRRPRLDRQVPARRRARVVLARRSAARGSRRRRRRPAAHRTPAVRERRAGQSLLRPALARLRRRRVPSCARRARPEDRPRTRRRHAGVLDDQRLAHGVALCGRPRWRRRPGLAALARAAGPPAGNGAGSARADVCGRRDSDRRVGSAGVVRLTSAEQRTSAGDSTQSDAQRVWFWRVGAQAALDHPLLGVGVGRLPGEGLALAARAADVPTNAADAQAHNIFVQLAAECGIPLALAALGALAVWLRRAWRVARRPEPIAVVALTLPILVHANLEHPLGYLYFLGLLGLLFGFVAAAAEGAGCFGRPPSCLRTRFASPPSR